MFKAILKAEPHITDRFSTNAKSFVLACLEKDPKKRLGAGGNIQALKRHPWFAKLDWEKLYARQYQMEYKPSASGAMDLSNFDARFVNQKMDLAKVTDASDVEMKAPEIFPGFAVDRAVLERQRGNT